MTEQSIPCEPCRRSELEERMGAGGAGGGRERGDGVYLHLLHSRVNAQVRGGREEEAGEEGRQGRGGTREGRRRKERWGKKGLVEEGEKDERGREGGREGGRERERERREGGIEAGLRRGYCLSLHQKIDVVSCGNNLKGSFSR
eukprot:541710-Hanusia_phi.AAC.2